VTEEMRWVPRRSHSSNVAGALAIIVLAGCGSAHSAATPTRAAGSSAVPTPPQRLTATRMAIRNTPFGVIKSGTVIPGREVGARAFAESRHGFGLANITNGETFPAATTNGGRTWRIDGPAFHVPAANGPAGVSYTGVASRRTYFAYGSSVVDVTTDGGTSWWQTFLGEFVLVVLARHGHLIAVVQQQAASNTQSLKAVDWVYVSRDGGRHWHHNDKLGAD
jgi:hypothetical protein